MDIFIFSTSEGTVTSTQGNSDSANRKEVKVVEMVRKRKEGKVQFSIMVFCINSQGG